MTAELNNYSIYFSLTERRGDKTDRLINEIKELSQRMSIYDDVTLVNAVPAKTSSAEDNTLTYRIQITSPTSKKAVDIINFLEHLFQKMFDKYPAFTEPEL